MIKVATYNVNSIRARRELLFRWLEREPVDVLCLQELKQEEENFPYGDFEALGYRCAVFSQKAYNGVCICSKLPLEEVRKGFGDEFFDRQRRLISARTGDLWFINVYAPHGDLRGTEKFRYKLAFYERLLSYLKENHSPRERICMLGDFNVALEDRDVFDPELLRDTIGTMKEEREAFRRILDWGFRDAFRYLYPDRIQFTWWDYIGGMIWKNKGMRIDYILVTEPLKDKVRDVYVDLWPRRRRSPKPSDHAPLVGVFEL
ncbi:MAG TPA: exodeoxyribonuclease III [Aquifex aeolicus]|uniref:Exodeoxyribonuclease III n=1 Tax=Aquifex aeolicus TaxID=63363 RepID=A0A7C5LBE2_AQUAO|nr:exodeoxyribonuclease III [Aquifex aeolicus]